MKASRLISSVIVSHQRREKAAEYFWIHARRGIALPRTLCKAKRNKPWYHVFTIGIPWFNAYMADEWCVETHDEAELFEKLSLEGAASGLSWNNILTKRNAYRKTFHNFDIAKVAAMTDRDVKFILGEIGDPRNSLVVRHRGKIESVISNAKCIQKLQAENVNFGEYLWSFVDNKPILNRIKSFESLPISSKESKAMSAALTKCGFQYVDPETCYSLMQSVGMVVDHPFKTPEWKAAHDRLQKRPGGYQDRSVSTKSKEKASPTKSKKKTLSTKSRSTKVTASKIRRSL